LMIAYPVFAFMAQRRSHPPESGAESFVSRGAHPRFIEAHAAQFHTSRSTCTTKTLFFNIEVNLRRGAVLNYLPAVQFHL
jgi:hypothetical protein